VSFTIQIIVDMHVITSGVFQTGRCGDRI